MDIFKKLKYAGFPQEIKKGHMIDYINDLGDPKKDEWVYVPTLSELIERCGDRFTSLSLNGNGMWPDRKWGSSAQNNIPDGEIGIIVYGRTPSESVANLLLAIMKE